ncbi:hypothetical protein KIL84_009905 [Mauremys mutica]|uniref:Uncharacterized protein n=1 Tax=Mauremys mutica TaxID=74926 RepID=A0A9D3XMF5_9SAUR|nr:hypothetical protein KIL84_009905 [Mauremys mutica]
MTIINSSSAEKEARMLSAGCCPSWVPLLRETLGFGWLTSGITLLVKEGEREKGFSQLLYNPLAMMPWKGTETCTVQLGQFASGVLLPTSTAFTDVKSQIDSSGARVLFSHRTGGTVGRNRRERCGGAPFTQLRASALSSVPLGLTPATARQGSLSLPRRGILSPWPRKSGNKSAQSGPLMEACVLWKLSETIPQAAEMW